MVILNEHMGQLQEKLQLLLKEYRQLQKENHRLEKEVANLQQSQNTKAIELVQMEQKIAAAQFSGGNWDEAEKNMLQKKIDAYLKEIDKCLALLHA